MRRSGKFGGGVISRPQAVNDTESKVDSKHNTTTRKERKDQKKVFQDVQTSEGKQDRDWVKKKSGEDGYYSRSHRSSAARVMVVVVVVQRSSKVRCRRG
jgi:hypothetical protein